MKAARSPMPPMARPRHLKTPPAALTNAPRPGSLWPMRPPLPGCLLAAIALHPLCATEPSPDPAALAALAQTRLDAHRFAEARDAALELRELAPGELRPLELLADASLELGDLAEARAAVQTLVQLEGGTLAAIPRQARLDWLTGKIESARDRLEQGIARAGKLSAPNPALAADLHLQLGSIAFTTGDWEAAEASFQAAEKLQPGSWRAADHLAELRAAQGRLEEAVTLYEKLAKRLPRPEFAQALADVLLTAKRPEEAAAWKERAEAGFLASIQAGGFLYFRHLACFYAENPESAGKALEWAREDLGQRHDIYAYDSYAWALYKNGRLPEAVDAIGKALATGSRDPHLLYHAGLIRMAAGDFTAGKAAFQQAAAVNPRFNTFHVHR